MNHRTWRSLDKIQQDLERQGRRRSGRVSTAPVVLALGLVLADVILTYLVPVIWESLLPDGLDQADSLVGLPGLVWRAAVSCQRHQGMIRVAIGVVIVVGLVGGLRARPLRQVTWLAAVGVILLNAVILIVTLQTSLRATARAAGIDLG